MTKQLNVLLVVYAFPPAAGVGVLRAASLARYLPNEGIRLDVLTTRNSSAVGLDPSLLEDIPPAVTIHRTMTLDLPFSLKKRLKRVVTGGRPPSPAEQGTAQPSSGVLKRAFQDLFLPDPQVVWLPVLSRVAPRIVRNRAIDLVIITGAPFSDYLLAERLRKQFPGLPIVLDFRDEWLSTLFGRANFQFNRSQRARRFAIKAEASAIASATAVVAVTEGARTAIRSRYPEEPDEKFHYLPNGFDGTRVAFSEGPLPHPYPGKVLFTYVGSVYASTEPTAVAQALDALPAELKARVKLRFIGHIEEPRYRDSLLRLGDMVELVGHMPQRAAMKAVRESDYALLITHDPLNISAKFYDYLGTGTPIVACIHPDGDVRRLLEKVRGGWWADSQNIDSMTQLFTNAILRRDSLGQTFRPDRAAILQYERKAIAQRYAALLHSLCGLHDQGSTPVTDENVMVQTF